MTSVPLLNLRVLSKSYPGVKALDQVSLTVRRGTVHALVGENGAGKSTLIKCLAGVVKPDEMALEVDGQPVSIHHAGDSREAGMAFIHQELNLIEYFTAPENVFLGHTLPKKRGLFDRRQLARQTRAIFEELGVDVDFSEPVRYLTPGRRAMVAIGRAFAHEAQVYFMDEPATALTSEEKQHLFAMIRRLTDQGKSVVYVTHNLDDVLTISDEITVFREGKRVAHSATGETTKPDLIAAMIGEEAGTMQSGAERARSVGDEVFAVEGLQGAGVGPVSFAVRAGEILGIGGLVGSGRSTLLKLLTGAVRAQTGAFRLQGGAIGPPRNPEQASKLGLVLIPEERRSEGLALQRTVFENTILGSLRRFSRSGLVRFDRARTEVAEAGRRVRLKTTSYDAAVTTLSGGNQQKVLFARAVMAEPGVLLLDEPTKGVDVGARKEIYEVIRTAAAGGMGIILVSSDFEEILSLADRFVFLRDGEAVGAAGNDGLNQNQYLTFCYQGVRDER